MCYRLRLNFYMGPRLAKNFCSLQKDEAASNGQTYRSDSFLNFWRKKELKRGKRCPRMYFWSGERGED